MNRMASVVKLHLKDRWSWFYIPWLVLFSSFFVNIVVSFFVADTMYTGGIMSLYIYIFVAGIIVLAQTFPFALGFNIRRTDYFFGTVLLGMIVSAATAFMLMILSIIEYNLTGGWGTDLRFFHLPYLNDGTLLGQVWVNFILLLHMFFLGFVISAIYRRFGLTGMFSFFIIVFLVISGLVLASMYFHWWEPIFSYFRSFTAVELATRLVLPIVIYLIASYAMLRRSTV